MARRLEVQRLLLASIGSADVQDALLGLAKPSPSGLFGLGV